MQCIRAKKAKHKTGSIVLYGINELPWNWFPFKRLPSRVSYLSMPRNLIISFNNERGAAEGLQIERWMS